MAIPMTKEEYRPSVAEVTDSILENSRFKGYLEGLVESFLDKTPQEQKDVLNAFSIVLRRLVSNTEASLIEQHFDQKDF